MSTYVNRVTLLESIEAARNRVQSVERFHGELSERNRDLTCAVAWHAIQLSLASLGYAERIAAELEAWGDGP